MSYLQKSRIGKYSVYEQENSGTQISVDMIFLLQMGIYMFVNVPLIICKYSTKTEFP